MIRRALLVALVFLAVLPGLAMALSVSDVAEEVRCPTCNTPLNVSSSPVAQRMKLYIARRIELGWSKDRIIDGLADEFGPAVRTTPPKSGFDLLAWIVPALAVGLGLAAIPVITRAWARRPRPVTPETAPITDDERRRLDEELGPPI